MKISQLGKFTISKAFLIGNTDEVAQIFSYLKIVPVRTEVLFEHDLVEYLAISEAFRELPEGETPPRYTITVKTDDVGLFESAKVTENLYPEAKSF